MMLGSDNCEENSIIIRELRLRCIVGINEHERHQKQDVLISLELWTDFKKAVESDSIENAADYKSLTKEIITKVEASKYFLVETLADMVARICLSRENIRKVLVVVEKPGALRFASSVGVRIVRSKSDAND